MSTVATVSREITALRLHPDAERVPLADRGDLATLRASLAENGQQDPIDITPDDVILDGRTRWTLLRDLGAQSVLVRVVDMPPEHQTSYIVDRALARRHLTAEQKRALNALLREVVVEEVPHPITREVVRVGKGPSERAATLGVTRQTVRDWDRGEDAPARNLAGGPTHYRRASDQTIQPLHPDRTSYPRPAPAPRAPRPSTKPRVLGPPWQRHFTLWCRSALPEHRGYLTQMSSELHKALERLGLQCEGVQ